MAKPKKKIDAVRLVRRIRDAHYEKLKDASREDRIAFYNSKVSRPQSDSEPARKLTM
ncbi:MAG: hypothetical protein WD205_11485 [Rhodothermales bacterium]